MKLGSYGARTRGKSVVPRLLREYYEHVERRRIERIRVGRAVSAALKSLFPY